MDELLNWRDEFPILNRTTHLISNSLGAMPRGVYSRLRDYAKAWDTRGVRAWEEGWWEMAVKVGDRIGVLLGAAAGDISLHQNVTLTQAVITSCFDFAGPRNKVVLVDMEFPSIIYFYTEQQRRGAHSEVVKSEDGIHIPLEKLLAAIDQKTLLVPLEATSFPPLSKAGACSVSIALPISGRACVLALRVPPTYPNDPADRIIRATALAEGLVRAAN